jgi:hypothetical protein
MCCPVHGGNSRYRLLSMDRRIGTFLDLSAGSSRTRETENTQPTELRFRGFLTDRGTNELALTGL